MSTTLTTQLNAVKLNGLHRHGNQRLILETDDGPFHTAASFRDTWRLYLLQSGEVTITLNDAHIATDVRFTCIIIAAQRRHARNHLLDRTIDGQYIVSYDAPDFEPGFSPLFNTKEEAVAWLKSNI